MHRELAEAQQQLREKVNAENKLDTQKISAIFFLTAGGTAREGEGDSPTTTEEGRGNYQKRAAADSGDETES